MPGMQLAEGYIDLTVRNKGFLSSMQRVELKLAKVQAKMERVANVAKRVLMAGGAIAGASVKAFASFEKQMAFVSTMLDDQAMKLMPAYTKAMKNMAMEFGEGTATITRGLYEILSASVAPEKALEVLRVSMKAAAAGMTTTSVAADAIPTVLNSYQLEAKYAGAVSDEKIPLKSPFSNSLPSTLLRSVLVGK